MSTASRGRALEHKTRDVMIAAGWHLVARSAGSKGAADLVMVSAERGLALIQVGTESKSLGPAARRRLLALADLCGALPLVAVCAPRLPIRWWLVGSGPASTWEGWDL